jgi:hypothetical protein
MAGHGTIGFGGITLRFKRKGPNSPPLTRLIRLERALAAMQCLAQHLILAADFHYHALIASELDHRFGLVSEEFAESRGDAFGAQVIMRD